MKASPSSPALAPRKRGFMRPPPSLPAKAGIAKAWPSSARRRSAGAVAALQDQDIGFRLARLRIGEFRRRGVDLHFLLPDSALREAQLHDPPDRRLSDGNAAAYNEISAWRRSRKQHPSGRAVEPHDQLRAISKESLMTSDRSRPPGSLFRVGNQARHQHRTVAAKRARQQQECHQRLRKRHDTAAARDMP